MPVEQQRIIGHIEAHQTAKVGSSQEGGILRALYVDLLGNQGTETGVFQLLARHGAFTANLIRLGDIETALMQVSTLVTQFPGEEDASYFAFDPMYPTDVIGLEFITAPETNGQQYQMFSVLYNNGESVHLTFFRGSRRNRFIPAEVSFCDANQKDDPSEIFMTENSGFSLRSFTVSHDPGGSGEPEPIPFPQQPLTTLRRAA